MINVAVNRGSINDTVSDEHPAGVEWRAIGLAEGSSLVRQSALLDSRRCYFYEPPYRLGT